VAAAAPKALVDAPADEAGEVDTTGAPNAEVLVGEAASKALVVAAADDAGLVLAPNALEAPKEGALVAAEAAADAEAGMELGEPKPKEPNPADMLVVEAEADEAAFAPVDEIPNAGLGGVSLSLDGVAALAVVIPNFGTEAAAEAKSNGFGATLLDGGVPGGGVAFLRSSSSAA